MLAFDLLQVTLRVTSLGSLPKGDRVNVERAARFGDEIGGHQMPGHIICTAPVIRVTESENSRNARFRLPGKRTRYLFTKGFIGVDGISLTINKVRNEIFDVTVANCQLSRGVALKQPLTVNLPAEILQFHW